MHSSLLSGMVTVASLNYSGEKVSRKKCLQKVSSFFKIVSKRISKIHHKMLSYFLEIKDTILKTVYILHNIAHFRSP